MESYDVGRLIYLGILGSALIGYFLISGRESLGKTLRSVTLWGLIFVGMVAGYGLWDDIRNEVAPRQTYIQDTGQIAVPRSPDGHYYLTLDINGAPVRFVVDTGASEMVLTLNDARRIGIDVDKLAFLGRAETANGLVSTASVRLSEVVLGPVTDRNMPAAVNAGEMAGSLLGMRYLSRFDTLEISGGQLVLTR